MIKIVQYTKIENSYYFFAEGKKKGLTANEVSLLIEMGTTNITHNQLDMIIK